MDGRKLQGVEGWRAGGFGGDLFELMPAGGNFIDQAEIWSQAIRSDENMHAHRGRNWVLLHVTRELKV